MHGEPGGPGPSARGAARARKPDAVFRLQIANERRGQGEVRANCIKINLTQNITDKPSAVALAVAVVAVVTVVSRSGEAAVAARAPNGGERRPADAAVGGDGGEDGRRRQGAEPRRRGRCGGGE